MSKRKYRNRKVTYFGIQFDSQKEGNRYLYLRSELEAGRIRDLECQPKFTLWKGFRSKTTGKKIRDITYSADFKYYDLERDIWVIEDVKSKATKTQVYRMKKKMLMKIIENENMIFEEVI